MIDQILETFQYTSAPVIGLIVLGILLGIVAIGSVTLILIKDVVAGVGSLFSLEGFAFVIMLAAIVSVAYYFAYG